MFFITENGKIEFEYFTYSIYFFYYKLFSLDTKISYERYMPPEHVIDRSFQPSELSFVWSLGVVGLELALGLNIIDENILSKVDIKVIKYLLGQVGCYTQNFEAFLVTCFNRDILKRPRFLVLSKDPFFRKNTI